MAIIETHRRLEYVLFLTREIYNAKILQDVQGLSIDNDSFTTISATRAEQIFEKRLFTALLEQSEKFLQSYSKNILSIWDIVTARKLLHSMFQYLHKSKAEQRRISVLCRKIKSRSQVQVNSAFEQEILDDSELKGASRKFSKACKRIVAIHQHGFRQLRKSELAIIENCRLKRGRR